MIRRATFLARGAEEELMVIDIGVRGVFVERGEPLSVNEEVQARFTLPENELPIRVRCRVAWWHAPDQRLFNKVLPPGVGLEFLDLSEEDRRRVREHVVEHCKLRLGTRRFDPSWPEGSDS